MPTLVNKLDAIQRHILRIANHINTGGPLTKRTITDTIRYLVLHRVECSNIDGDITIKIFTAVSNLDATYIAVVDLGENNYGISTETLMLGGMESTVIIITENLLHKGTPIEKAISLYRLFADIIIADPNAEYSGGDILNRFSSDTIMDISVNTLALYLLYDIIRAWYTGTTSELKEKICNVLSTEYKDVTETSTNQSELPEYILFDRDVINDMISFVDDLYFDEMGKDEIITNIFENSGFIEAWYRFQNTK